MPYGTIKVDNVIYTKGGVDTTITVSGIVDSLSGAISVTGAISGASVSAPTGTFTTLSGNTTAGTTATFVTGVFTTSLSGATITGNTGQFSNITGVSGVFTTRISGATITGNTGQFSSITGISGVFTSVSGTTFTVTSGVFASGTAVAPSVSVGTTTNGLYSSATNEVALATNSTSRLVVDASGNVNIDSGTFYVDAVNNRVGVGTTGPSYALHVLSSSTSSVKFGASSAIDTQALVGNSAGDLIIRTTSGGDSIIASDTGKYLAFGTNGVSEKMRLDASGNLGLGVTPSAWASSFGLRAFQVGPVGALSSLQASTTNNQTFLTTNAVYLSGTGWAYQYADKATQYYQSGGLHAWFTAPTGTAGAAITFTQAMTLDASGNLGVANTSPSSYDADFRNLVIGTSGSTGISIISGTASNGTLAFGDGTGAANYRGYIQYAHTSDSLILGTAASPRATIDSAGRLLIGQTGTGLQAARSMAWQGSGEGTLYLSHSTSDGNGDPYIRFGYNASQTGSIVQAGNTGIGLTSVDYLALGAGNSEKARIDSSGRLLVGATTDSGGALLQINGDRIRVATAKTPASATATGTAGEVCWDANYIYVCTATNTWKRAAIATW